MKTTTLASFVLLVGVSLASADPAPHATVVHVPPTRVVAGDPIDLEVAIDLPFVEKLELRWRQIGDPTWLVVAFDRSSAGGWYARIPPAESPGVEYFIRGTDRDGATVDHFASEAVPHAVRIDPSLEDRLEELDRTRLANRDNEVAIDVIAHDFGNRYGARDRFLRGEVAYNYKISRTLHEIGFGFGTIAGHTPLMSTPGTDDLYRGMRYGFGQVQVRVHPSVFLDGRIGLGVTQDDFEGIGRAGITFGKPWRSCVQLGAEYIGQLGPTAFVRLQWDTAPPLLMGASIVKTDLPGAIVEADGLYIAYDVAYRMDRITLKAQVSYGARDGAAHFGGGLGTAVAF